MASQAVRKKRNFKALALQVDNPTNSSDIVTRPPVKAGMSGNQVTAVAATRAAPSAPGKKKPPAMDLSKSRSPPETTTSGPERSPSLLAVSTPKSAALTTSSPSRSSYHSLQERLATMEIGHSDAVMDLKADDFRTLHELGQGNGGTVSKVEHIPTRKIMAKKVLLRLVRITTLIE